MQKRIFLTIFFLILLAVIFNFFTGSFSKPSFIESSFPERQRSRIADWLTEKYNTPHHIAEKIAHNAQKLRHGLLLVAVMTVESDVRPHLKYANNYGLCQVSDVHLQPHEQKRIQKSRWTSMRDCRVFSVKDLYDIEKNMCAANAIMERLYDMSNGDIKKTLLRYNANERLKYGYKRKVLQRYQDLQNYM